MRQRSTVRANPEATAERSVMDPATIAREWPPPTLRRRLPAAVLVAVVVLGVGLRLWMSTLGSNWDLGSYATVAAIVEAGGNVYAETDRYNYGPVWMHVVHGVARLSAAFPDSRAAFGFLIGVALTLVDLALFLLLRKHGGDVVASLFFLNPVSIIITGYHRQFGNLALLLGLVAANLFDRSRTSGLDWRKWTGIGVLALSLMTKHILFAFPWWLAVKQRGLRDRLIVLLAPAGLFLLSFTPYWSSGSHGILHNVLLYRSFHNAPLWNGVMPPVLSNAIPAEVGFLAALAAGGLLFARRRALESALLYSAVLLVFSPAIANQYLALVMPFVVWFLNPFGIAYLAGATFLLAASSDELHLIQFVSDRWIYTWGFSYLVSCLGLALIWPFWGPNIRHTVTRGFAWIRRSLSEVSAIRR